jgi:hypothetical protein
MIEYVFIMSDNISIHAKTHDYGIKENNITRVKNLINTITGIEIVELNKCEIKEVKK